MNNKQQRQQRYHNVLLLRRKLLLLLLVSVIQVQQQHVVKATGAGFNYEVEKRLLDLLGFYMGIAPVESNDNIVNFRINGGFPNNMKASDRDLFLIYAYTLTQPLLYYGLEDGSISGYYWDYGYYREPGNSGYNINDPKYKKHLKSCINSITGKEEDCILQNGSQYIKCINDCQLIPCPNNNMLLSSSSSQTAATTTTTTTTNCTMILDFKEKELCLQQQIWCPNYIIETYNYNDDDDDGDDDDDDIIRGFLPLTNYCYDKYGHFNEGIGNIVSSDGTASATGNCQYGSENRLVQRRLNDTYAYCNNNNNNNNDDASIIIKKSCDTTFAGGFQSGEYDPRYRPWYIRVRNEQRAIWLEPYPFFSLGLGMTYAQPIYTTSNDGKKIFDGVVAVDIRLEDITRFLIENYGNSTTAVVICEDEYPHYIIGSSTGSDPARNFLTSNISEPCPFDKGDDVPCTPIRVQIKDLSGHPLDRILYRSFDKHSKEGFPEQLLSVTATDDVKSLFYVSQSTLYEQANLRWRLIIASPGETGINVDKITIGNPLLPAICIISCIGFSICLLMFVTFIKKRSEPAIIQSDWRFTCAFIFGCTILNLSTLTLLGENTNFMCQLRMWSFNLLVSFALAPLFIKVWRMNKLVGQRHMTRISITNTQATAYTFPIILIQITILIVITMIDPPKQTEVIDQTGGIITQHVICKTKTNALFISQTIFDSALVFTGCILAYITRNIDEKFGESKQLIFAMYNIALVGIIIVIALSMNADDIESNGKSILQAIAVLWATVFCSAAFVIPRLIKVRSMNRDSHRYSRQVHVSGIENTTRYQTNTNFGGYGVRSSDLSSVQASEIDSTYEAGDDIDENKVYPLPTDYSGCSGSSNDDVENGKNEGNNDNSMVDRLDDLAPREKMRKLEAELNSKEEDKEQQEEGYEKLEPKQETQEMPSTKKE